MKQKITLLKCNLGACLEDNTGEILNISVRSVCIRFRCSILLHYLFYYMTQIFRLSSNPSKRGKDAISWLQKILRNCRVFVLAHLLDSDQKKLMLFASELNGIASFLENLIWQAPWKSDSFLTLCLSIIRLS